MFAPSLSDGALRALPISLTVLFVSCDSARLFLRLFLCSTLRTGAIAYPIRRDLISLPFTDSSFRRFFHLTRPVFVIARTVLAPLKRVGRFFKIRFQRHDRSPFSIMPTYLYPAEVPTNVSLRSECSRCLLSKTERWLTIFLDWYVFEPNVKSNLTLALSFFSLSLLLHSFLVVTITSKVRITRYHNG